MLKGNPGEWYQDDYIGGYFDNNGDGFYDEFGKYRAFGREY